MTARLFDGTRGPRKARCLVVGEAFGEQERQKNVPFVGGAGVLLESMLEEAGINPKDCLFANCIAKKPYGNDMRNFLIANDAPIGEWLNGVRPTPELQHGLYTLDQIIEQVEPTIIIACGAWPTWWLTGKLDTKTAKGYKLPYGIDKWRGSQLFTTASAFGRRAGIPILPVIHPAAILRKMSDKFITVQDLRRAAGYLAGTRELWIDPVPRNFLLRPTASDVEDFVHDVMKSPECPIVNDLETKGGRTHICGLADNSRTGIVIPMFDFDKNGTWNIYSYEDYHRIHIALRILFNNPEMKFVGQNYIYDQQYIRQEFGQYVNCTWDTMVAQHVCFPALRKGLDFLSSMYCDHHVYWKDERKESIANEDLDQACAYNAIDLWRTYDIFCEQKNVVKQLGVEKQFAERMELSACAVRMSGRGLPINEKLRQAQKTQLFKYVMELTGWLDKVIPPYVIPEATTKTAWYNSPKQKAAVLYDSLGFKEQRNKTGGRTTDKEALAALAERYPYYAPVFSVLIILNSISTIAGNYLSAELDPDQRMRCTFTAAGPKTMRMASYENSFGRGTNLQNVLRPRNPMDAFAQELV